MKYLFEATEGKVEYIQDKYNQEDGIHKHQPVDFAGGLYLENRMWVNYYECAECNEKFTTFGMFNESDE